ncbi:hypothetical protein B0H19DRAFT_912814, partial [Mycena capillaripes]
LTSNKVPLDAGMTSIRTIVSEGQDQIDTLNAQIDSLQAALAQLVQKRDEIEEFVRAHRAIVSPIRRVPPELICQILALALPSDGEAVANNPPWYLGHICQSWRLCALASPDLWRFIAIPSPPG